MMSGNEWEDVCFRGILGGAAGWAVMFLIYLFLVAPLKAWNAEHPLAIKIKKQKSRYQITQGGIHRHSVFIVLQNKSPLMSVRCSLLVKEASIENHKMPWPVYTSNIPPNDEHKVELAVWFFWKNNRENYPILIFAERAGAFAEANQLSLPQSGADIILAIQSVDFPEITAKCRLVVDLENENLVLEKLNDH